MTTAKTRVLFVSTDLGGGGAERVISVLLDHLDRAKFELALVLFQDRLAYSLPGDVPVIVIEKRAWYDLPKLVWKLSSVYRNWKPDVIISFLRYTNIVAAAAFQLSHNKARLLLSEHAIPSFNLKQHRDPLNILFDQWLPRWLYRYADHVICVSAQSSQDVHQIYGIPVGKIKLIYNPIDIRKIVTLSKEQVDHPWFSGDVPIIVSVGRLTGIKGYPYLLRAFAEELKRQPSHLMILGTGDQEVALKELTKRLGIEGQVTFLGFQANPFKYAARSTMFVLSSLTEAFPMVLLEAMACGLPVVSTASPGPSEIITDGVDGLLVSPADEKGLAEAIDKLLIDRPLAESLAQAGRHRVEAFSVDNIITEYEELIGSGRQQC